MNFIKAWSDATEKIDNATPNIIKVVEAAVSIASLITMVGTAKIAMNILKDQGGIVEPDTDSTQNS